MNTSRTSTKSRFIPFACERDSEGKLICSVVIICSTAREVNEVRGSKNKFKASSKWRANDAWIIGKKQKIKFKKNKSLK